MNKIINFGKDKAKKMNFKLPIVVLIFIVYFVLGLVTIKDYGISWDEPTHFYRGQAYIWYFLTGQKNFKSLPPYDLLAAQINPAYHVRSFYQSDSQDFTWLIANDGDHPVLNDTLAALSNYVFYQKLGILGDIQSFHLFEIFVSAILVALVFYWCAEIWGVLPGIFSALFMATYPLFWAESHFNIKDPPETLFFSLALYFLWKTIKAKKTVYLIITSIITGIAISIKFNIFFAAPIALPWLIYLFILNENKLRTFVFSKKFILAFALFPIIVFGIFFLHWPWLWQDLVANTKEVFGYYKGIGLEQDATLGLLLTTWNLYAPRWILFTTQPLMLLAFAAGLLFSVKKLKENSGVLLLWILWFVITIGRVVIPGTVIYGGVRQIMEYIPPMAMLAGWGLWSLIKSKCTALHLVILAVSLVILLVPLIKLHPNENVYFNSLSGGLKKNVDSGLPAAGFSFGNAYQQGMNWINKNVESGAKLALVQGTMLNIPTFTVRNDILYSNSYWSGIQRQGEYLIDLTFNYNVRIYPYVWEYVGKILDPVYEVKVEGVPILTIWKNDFKHTKEIYRKNESIISSGVKFSTQENLLTVSLSQRAVLSKILIYFKKEVGCQMPKASYIETSVDGSNWYREKDVVPDEQISGIRAVDNKRLIFFFAAREAKFIRFIPESSNSCIMDNPSVDVYELR